MEKNIIFPGPKKGGKNFTEEKLFEFTEAQREFAANAKIPNDLDELRFLVMAFEMLTWHIADLPQLGQQLQSGARINDFDYIFVSTDIHPQ